MSDEPLTAEAFHLRCAKNCFNGCWSILDQPERTPEDEAHLLNMAHASLFHWRKVGEPVNFARGEWLLSRVNAVLDRGEMAVHHGQRCLDISEANDLSAFDRAVAHEAIARGLAILSDMDGAAQHVERALDMAKDIDDPEERKILDRDLRTIPGAPTDETTTADA